MPSRRCVRAHLDGDGLEVEAGGGVVVGGNRLGVAVHHDGLVPARGRWHIWLFDATVKNVWDAFHHDVLLTPKKVQKSGIQQILGLSPLVAQREGGVATAVVELNALTDAIGAAAQDEHLQGETRGG